MPDYIDSSDYLNPKRPLRRRRFVIIAALLLASFVVARLSLSAWVDLLWFESLGYGGVFWKNLVVEVVVFSSVFGDHLHRSVRRFSS